MALLLNTRVEIFSSLQPQQSEISRLFKWAKTLVEGKNYKREVDRCAKCESQRLMSEDESLKWKEYKPTQWAIPSWILSWSETYYSPSLQPVPITL